MGTGWRAGKLSEGIGRGPREQCPRLARMLFSVGEPIGCREHATTPVLATPRHAGGRTRIRTTPRYLREIEEGVEARGKISVAI